MANETERKYLVTWPLEDIVEEHIRLRSPPIVVKIQQGLLSSYPQVRIRLCDETGQKKSAFLTIKSGPRGPQGITREEYEYEIPREDGEALLDMCSIVTEKTRYKFKGLDHTWEVECYHGVNEGLLTAEVELKAEDDTPELPPWIGREITRESQYKNVLLATTKVVGDEEILARQKAIS